MSKPKKKKQEQKRVDLDDLSPSELVAHFGGTKSAAIRGLASEGLKVSGIAKKLEIRYQHARNVLTRPLKRGPRVPTTNSATSEGSTQP